MEAAAITASEASMAAEDPRGWELNKANSLRFRHHTHRYHDPSSSLAKNKNRHHHRNHRNQDFAVPLPHDRDHHEQATGYCSISNQNIHSNTMVDSIEILPIFHKLLEDKRSSDCAFNNATTDSSSSRHYNKEATAATANGTKPKSRFHSARSCPDMSVRCDIVEYL